MSSWRATINQHFDNAIEKLTQAKAEANPNASAVKAIAEIRMGILLESNIFRAQKEK